MDKASVISHCHVSRGAIWVKSCWFSLLPYCPADYGTRAISDKAARATSL